MPVKHPKHPPPPRVRPRVGAVVKYVQLLQIAAAYLAGQAKAAIGPKLVTQAAAVKTGRDDLNAKLDVRTGLRAELAIAESDVVNAAATLVTGVRGGQERRSGDAAEGSSEVAGVPFRTPATSSWGTLRERSDHETTCTNAGLRLHEIPFFFLWSRGRSASRAEPASPG